MPIEYECILGYLYSRGEDGAYRERILLHLPHTQSPDRLQKFLDELLYLDKIELLPPTKSRHEGGKIYRITQSGKCTVDKYLSADYNEVTIVPIMI